MNTKLAWPAVLLSCVGMVVAGVMAIMKVSQDLILLVVSLMITPVITALVAGQIAKVEGSQQQLIQNTNGNLSRLVDIIERQSQMLHLSQPPPSDTASPPPPATSGSPDAAAHP